MNLSIKNHLMTRKVLSWGYNEKGDLMVLFELFNGYNQEYLFISKEEMRTLNEKTEQSKKATERSSHQ